MNAMNAPIPSPKLELVAPSPISRNASLNVNQNSPVPLYTQIKEVLRTRILDGTYQPHQQTPSESEMMTAFSVSRITVRQALGDLENEGLIFRIHGKGTFVSKPKAFQDLGKLQGFGQAMRQMGYETYSRVLSFQTIKATPQIQERLRLSKRAKVVEIKRLRFLNREPISLDISYLPVSLGSQLAKSDLASRDIFTILENEIGLSLGHSDLQIGTALADEALGQQLRLESGSPILVIERTTYSSDEAPIDFEHLYYRGDSFQYHIRVNRNPAQEKQHG